MSSIEKMLGISSASLAAAVPPGHSKLLASFGRLGQELEALLQAKNGFYAFASALHVFPVCDDPANFSGVDCWNSEAHWKYAYAPLSLRPMLCFAEDAFGEQFALLDDAVIRFAPETGETEFFAPDLAHWADKILADYNTETGYPIAHEWQIAFGALPTGMRLVPKIPFVMGGAYETANLQALRDVAGMRLRADIACQIAGLPDGTHVSLRID